MRIGMRVGRIGLLVATLSLATSTAFADSLVTWEFSGAITGVPNSFGLADLYPVGTPVTFELTLNTAAPKVGPPPWSIYYGESHGVYEPIVGATLSLGDATFSRGPGGFLMVNCQNGLDCFGRLPEWVEFFIPTVSAEGFWSPSRLNPDNSHSTIARVDLRYRDPSTNGRIPLTPPAGPAFLWLGVSGGGCCEASLSARFDSARAIEDMPVVPEPGSLILLGSGLLGLYARSRKH